MYLESRLWTRLTSEFLEEVQWRHHYEEKDMEQLKVVASDMVNCMKWQESTYLLCEEDLCNSVADEITVTAIMTLGAGIDLLQERYQKSGRILESYMVESIGNELLMLGYRQLEQYVWNLTGYHVVAFHFFGGEEGYPLEMMRTVLNGTEQGKVTCNEACCLSPKKSVVFLVDLSRKESNGCVELCDTCTRRHNCMHAGSI